MSTAWFLGVAADQAATPVLSGGVGSVSLPWWRVAILAAIFIGLLGVWFWVNRERVNFRGLLQPATHKIVFEEQRYMNPRTVVCLVEVGGERFLLAQSQGALAWQPLGKGRGPSSEKDS